MSEDDTANPERRRLYLAAGICALGAGLGVARYLAGTPQPPAGNPMPVEFGDLHAQRGQQLQHGLHIANAWDVMQYDRLFSKEGGSQQGEGGVLVAAGCDGPRQGLTTANDELIHKVDFSPDVERIAPY